MLFTSKKIISFYQQIRWVIKQMQFGEILTFWSLQSKAGGVPGCGHPGIPLSIKYGLFQTNHLSALQDSGNEWDNVHNSVELNAHSIFFSKSKSSPPLHTRTRAYTSLSSPSFEALSLVKTFQHHQKIEMWTEACIQHTSSRYAWSALKDQVANRADLVQPNPLLIPSLCNPMESMAI